MSSNLTALVAALEAIDNQEHELSLRESEKHLRRAVRKFTMEQNESLPSSRKVSIFATNEVVTRHINANLTAEDPRDWMFGAAREVATFMDYALTAAGKPLHQDLLPVGHPESLNPTRVGLSASAARVATARWHSDDARIDDSARKIVFAAYASEPGTVDHQYSVARMQAVTAGLIPSEFLMKSISALVAANNPFSGNNSSIARSMRAKQQRRDRKGRFAEMGGGARIFTLIDGLFDSFVGKFAGWGANDDEVEIEIRNHPNPKVLDGIYPVKASRVDAVKAVLGENALRNLKGNRAVFGPNERKMAVSLEELLASRKDAPTGWDSNGDGSFSSPDGYNARPNEDGTWALTGPDGSPLGSADGWAEVQRLASDNDDKLGVSPKPKARLGKKAAKNVQTEGFDQGPRGGKDAPNQLKTLLDSGRGDAVTKGLEDYDKAAQAYETSTDKIAKALTEDSKYWGDGRGSSAGATVQEEYDENNNPTGTWRASVSLGGNVKDQGGFPDRQSAARQAATYVAIHNQSGKDFSGKPVRQFPKQGDILRELQAARTPEDKRAALDKIKKIADALNDDMTPGQRNDVRKDLNKFVQDADYALRADEFNFRGSNVPTGMQTPAGFAEDVVRADIDDLASDLKGGFTARELVDNFAEDGTDKDFLANAEYEGLTPEQAQEALALRNEMFNKMEGHFKDSLADEGKTSEGYEAASRYAKKKMIADLKKDREEGFFDQGERGGFTRDDFFKSEFQGNETYEIDPEGINGDSTLTVVQNPTNGKWDVITEIGGPIDENIEHRMEETDSFDSLDDAFDFAIKRADDFKKNSSAEFLYEDWRDSRGDADDYMDKGFDQGDRDEIIPGEASGPEDRVAQGYAFLEKQGPKTWYDGTVETTWVANRDANGNVTEVVKQVNKDGKARYYANTYAYEYSDNSWNDVASEGPFDNALDAFEMGSSMRDSESAGWDEEMASEWDDEQGGFSQDERPDTGGFVTIPGPKNQTVDEVQTSLIQSIAKQTGKPLQEILNDPEMQRITNDIAKGNLGKSAGEYDSIAREIAKNAGIDFPGASEGFVRVPGRTAMPLGLPEHKFFGQDMDGNYTSPDGRIEIEGDLLDVSDEDNRRPYLQLLDVKVDGKRVDSITRIDGESEADFKQRAANLAQAGIDNPNYAADKRAQQDAEEAARKEKFNSPEEVAKRAEAKRIRDEKAAAKEEARKAADTDGLLNRVDEFAKNVFDDRSTNYSDERGGDMEFVVNPTEDYDGRPVIDWTLLDDQGEIIAEGRANESFDEKDVASDIRDGINQYLDKKTGGFSQGSRGEDSTRQEIQDDVLSRGSEYIDNLPQGSDESDEDFADRQETLRDTLDNLIADIAAGNKSGMSGTSTMSDDEFIGNLGQEARDRYEAIGRDEEGFDQGSRRESVMPASERKAANAAAKKSKYTWENVEEQGEPAWRVEAEGSRNGEAYVQIERDPSDGMWSIVSYASFGQINGTGDGGYENAEEAFAEAERFMPSYMDRAIDQLPSNSNTRGEPESYSGLGEYGEGSVDVSWDAENSEWKVTSVLFGADSQGEDRSYDNTESFDTLEAAQAHADEIADKMDGTPENEFFDEIARDGEYGRGQGFNQGERGSLGDPASSAQYDFVKSVLDKQGSKLPVELRDAMEEVLANRSATKGEIGAIIGEMNKSIDPNVPSDRQLNSIRRGLVSKGLPAKEAADIEKRLPTMTKAEASDLITRLKGMDDTNGWKDVSPSLVKTNSENLDIKYTPQADGTWNAVPVAPGGEELGESENFKTLAAAEDAADGINLADLPGQDDVEGFAQGPRDYGWDGWAAGYGFTKDSPDGIYSKTATDGSTIAAVKESGSAWSIQRFAAGSDPVTDQPLERLGTYRNADDAWMAAADFTGSSFDEKAARSADGLSDIDIDHGADIDNWDGEKYTSPDGRLKLEYVYDVDGPQDYGDSPQDVSYVEGSYDGRPLDRTVLDEVRYALAYEAGFNGDPYMSRTNKNAALKATMEYLQEAIDKGWYEDSEATNDVDGFNQGSRGVKLDRSHSGDYTNWKRGKYTSPDNRVQVELEGDEGGNYVSAQVDGKYIDIDMNSDEGTQLREALETIYHSPYNRASRSDLDNAAKEASDLVDRILENPTFQDTGFDQGSRTSPGFLEEDPNVLEFTSPDQKAWDDYKVGNLNYTDANGNMSTIKSGISKDDSGKESRSWYATYSNPENRNGTGTSTSKSFNNPEAAEKWLRNQIADGNKKQNKEKSGGFSAKQMEPATPAQYDMIQEHLDEREFDATTSQAITEALANRNLTKAQMSSLIGQGQAAPFKPGVDPTKPSDRLINSLNAKLLTKDIDDAERQEILDRLPGMKRDEMESLNNKLRSKKDIPGTAGFAQGEREGDEETPGGYRTPEEMDAYFGDVNNGPVAGRVDDLAARLDAAKAEMPEMRTYQYENGDELRGDFAESNRGVTGLSSMFEAFNRAGSLNSLADELESSLWGGPYSGEDTKLISDLRKASADLVAEQKSQRPMEAAQYDENGDAFAGGIDSDLYEMSEELDSHREMYFESDEDYVWDKLSSDGQYGDTRTGGAEGRISSKPNENGKYEATFETPEGGMERTEHDSKDDAATALGAKIAQYNSAKAEVFKSSPSRSASRLDLEQEAKDADANGTGADFVERVRAMADALEKARGDRSTARALRVYADRAEKNLGSFDAPTEGEPGFFQGERTVDRRQQDADFDEYYKRVQDYADNNGTEDIYQIQSAREIFDEAYRLAALQRGEEVSSKDSEKAALEYIDRIREYADRKGIENIYQVQNFREIFDEGYRLGFEGSGSKTSASPTPSPKMGEPATDAQYDYLKELADSKDGVDPDLARAIQDGLSSKNLTKSQMGAFLGQLRAMENKAGIDPTKPTPRQVQRAKDLANSLGLSPAEKRALGLNRLNSMSTDEIQKLIDNLKRRGGDQGGSGGVRPKAPTGDKPGGGFGQSERSASTFSALKSQLSGKTTDQLDGGEWDWPTAEGFDQAKREGGPKRHRVLEALGIASTIMGLFDNKPSARKGKENVDTVGAFANDLRYIKDDVAKAIDKFKNPKKDEDKFTAVLDFAKSMGDAFSAYKKAKARWDRNNPQKPKAGKPGDNAGRTPRPELGRPRLELPRGGLRPVPGDRLPALTPLEPEFRPYLEQQMNLLGETMTITSVPPLELPGTPPDLTMKDGTPIWFITPDMKKKLAAMRQEQADKFPAQRMGDGEIGDEFYAGFAQAPSGTDSPKDVAAVTRSNTDSEAELLSDLKARVASAAGRKNAWTPNYKATRGETRDDDMVTENNSPINPASDHVYSAGNMYALAAAAEERGYSDRRWMTEGQAAGMGAQVRQGEQGVRILAPTTRTLPDGSKVIEMKPTWVFNAEQMDNVGPDTAPRNSGMTAGEAVDFLLMRFADAESKRRGGDRGIQIREGGSKGPRWTPGGVDESRPEMIRMPDRSLFDSPEAYVQSLMHELTHAVGGQSRMKRKSNVEGLKGDQKQIDIEELTAELGSAILMQRLGVPYDRQKHAEYVKMYMDGGLLSDDDLNMAFRDAQLAADYALGNDVLPPWNNLSTDFTPASTGYRAPSGRSWSPDTTVGSSDAAPAFPAGTPGSEENPDVITGFAQDKRDGKKSVKDSQSAVDKVTDQIIGSLKDGKLPWRKPFKGIAGANMQRNPASKRIYTGFNQQILAMVQAERGYNDPRWMTYNQAQGMGGQVRKGEKGVFILVPMRIAREDAATGEDKSFVTFRAAAVFNVEQIDGLSLPTIETEAEGRQMAPLDAHEFIVERYKKAMEARTGKPVDITYRDMSDSESPHWSPATDKIVLPSQKQFNSPEDMFDTMAHEMVHSTGHQDRLDRTDLTKDYGNADGVARAKEELIAEIGAATIADMFGIETTLDNSTAYVRSWLERLQNHPEEVMQASRESQKAVDYLLGIDLGDWSPLEGYGLGNAVVPKTDEESES